MRAVGKHAAKLWVGRPVPSVDEQVHREPAQHLDEAAVVIGGRVRGHDGAEAVDALLAKQPRDARVRRSPVEQHGAAVWVLDQGRVALSDVEER